MTNAERKKLLPRGAQRRIAKRLNVWPSWVSQVVNTEETGQWSPRVGRAVVREIVKAHPNIDPDQVFPSQQLAKAS